MPGTWLAPRNVSQATGRLKIAAGSASTSDSASCSEARRPRVAPSETRRASSPLRVVARSRMSPATLAQQRSSTTPHTANSRSRLLRAGERIAPLVWPCEPGSSTSVREPNAVRCCSSTFVRRGASTSLKIPPYSELIEAAAASRVTPSLRRPKRCAQ